MWFGSASFILMTALCGCLLGFGAAAVLQGLKAKKKRQPEEEK